MEDKKITLVMASHNANKLKEMVELIKMHPQGDTILERFNFKLASDFNLEAPIEDGETFSANALIKAKYVSCETKCIAFSDDSGIAIDALNGDPGICSARWMESSESEAFDRVYKLMGDNPNRNAKFICVMCLYFPSLFQEKLGYDKNQFYFDGILNGYIAKEPTGTNGFAYDKVFIVSENNNLEQETIVELKDKTLAQVSARLKNQISHRKIALYAMIDFLLQMKPLKN